MTVCVQRSRLQPLVRSVPIREQARAFMAGEKKEKKNVFLELLFVAFVYVCANFKYFNT